MDASGLSPQEAAALEQIMQKKQVRSHCHRCKPYLSKLKEMFPTDEGLYDNVLWASREVLQRLRTRHELGKAQVRFFLAKVSCAETDRHSLYIIIRGPEETCINNCADKFLAFSARAGSRFSEINAEVRV